MSRPKMDFTFVEFPCTVDLNVFKAYFDLSKVRLPKVHGRVLQPASPTTEVHNHVKSLRHIVLDALVEQWNDYPVFKEIPRQEDRNYILSNLSADLPIGLLSAHISEDFFWHKAYQHRWKTCNQFDTWPSSSDTAGPSEATPSSPPEKEDTKTWISIYMERHLQEFMEQLEPGEYDVECVQKELDVAAAYINQLEIKHLQPTMPSTLTVAANAGSAPGGGGVGTAGGAAAGGGNASVHGRPPADDHIPLDYILHNLPELRALRLTYCTKTVGMNFYLGCNTLTQNDIYLLARGLSRCHELRKFCLHSTKLAAYQLKFLARSLDKGCHHLTELSLPHCALGDEGIRQFIESCTKESFATLRTLDLANNKISPEGAYVLSRVLRRIPLERLILRLNPIESDGAATIFCLLDKLPIRYLDVSCCSICVTIMKLFMKLLIQNRTLLHVDISNNTLSEEFGRHLYKIIGFNKVLQYMDLRNTGMSCTLRNRFKVILEKNRPRPEDTYFRVFGLEEEEFVEF